jgi:hypothetical protein
MKKFISAIALALVVSFSINAQDTKTKTADHSEACKDASCPEKGKHDYKDKDCSKDCTSGKACHDSKDHKQSKDHKGKDHQHKGEHKDHKDTKKA